MRHPSKLDVASSSLVSRSTCPPMPNPGTALEWDGTGARVQTATRRRSRQRGLLRLVGEVVGVGLGEVGSLTFEARHELLLNLQ